MPVVLLNGVDLLHGHRVEAHGIFQHTVLVKQRNSHRHDIFMGVVDGLGGGDLFLLPDDLRRDAGGKGAVRLQIKGGFAHDGIVGKAKVPLIVLTDPESIISSARTRLFLGLRMSKSPSRLIISSKK